MKKFITFILCALCVFALFSCADNKNADGTNETAGTTEQVSQNTSPDVTEKENQNSAGTEQKKLEKNPIPAGAAENACGENLTWSFDSETKVLTISGSGDMWDFVELNEETGGYRSVSRPWKKYQYRVESIVISDGVTSIGDHAFWDFRSVKSVSIPDSVKKIGRNAFAECYVLTSIKIPQGVTRIEDVTFDNCYKLANIEIPDSVTSIGNCAFEDCNDLVSIYIPASVTSIGENIFRKCIHEIEIRFGGTKEQWDAMNFTADNIDKITVVFDK